MKRLVISAVLALVLVTSAAVPAFAASSDTVSVTATPIFLTIEVTPVDAPLGSVVESSTYWAYGGLTTPQTPLATGECRFTTTNSSSVAVDISISASNFIGGVDWTLAATVGADQVVMRAGTVGTAIGSMVVVTTDPANNFTFHNDLGDTNGTEKWELSLETGTFGDEVLKTSVITLQARVAT